MLNLNLHHSKPQNFDNSIIVLPKISSLIFIILIFAWILPGLIGHEPWKPDEGYTFGLIQHITKTGDWIVPTLAGEPFMEKPPIFFITASIFSQLLSSWLPAPDAARLTSGFWFILAIIGIMLTAKNIFGENKNAEKWAIILLFGCLGLPIRAHQMITDTALFSGIAWGLCGLTYALNRQYLGGILLGLGGTVAFLSKGLIGPGCLGITAILLPLIFANFRNKNYLKTILTSIIVGAPLPTLWAVELYLRDPTLFADWLRINNIGRFSGTSTLGPTATPFFYFQTLPWYTFPALPLAIFGYWKARQTTNTQSRSNFDNVKALPILLFLIIYIFILSIAADARELYAMPLLIPLSIIGVNGLFAFSTNNANNINKITSSIIGVIALIVLFVFLLAGFALSSGKPQIIEQILTHKIFAGWQISWNLAYWFGFVILILIVSFLWRQTAKNLLTGVIWRWTLLITICWGGLASVLLPAIDHGKSYQIAFTTLKPVLTKINQKGECVASLWLGEPQRAMLEYYANYHTLRLDSSAKGLKCNWLLVQSLNKKLPQIVKYGELIITGKRYGDNRESYMLFHLTSTIRQIVYAEPTILSLQPKK